MKITLELPDALMRRVKLRAVRRNRGLKGEIAQLLEAGMASTPAPDASLGPPKPVRLRGRRPPRSRRSKPQSPPAGDRRGEPRSGRRRYQYRRLLLLEGDSCDRRTGGGRSPDRVRWVRPHRPPAITYCCHFCSPIQAWSGAPDELLPSSGPIFSHESLVLAMVRADERGYNCAIKEPRHCLKTSY